MHRKDSNSKMFHDLRTTLRLRLWSTLQYYRRQISSNSNSMNYVFYAFWRGWLIEAHVHD
ncbi:unnamed protein product [Periconia digitata]|uniref:Uncharacterized protein n=1 Tax=Periconia digitata TaxID=1303443 RepID=A0A9W4U2C4_9PLEO|nr:unnamed protein product [Periconia digitata]